MKSMTVGLVALAFAGMTLLSGYHGGCGSHDPEKRAERAKRFAASRIDDVLDEVDATDDQKKRIQSVADGVINQGLVIYADNQKVKAELHREWAAKTPDAAKVHAIVDERVDAARKLLHGLADAVITVHGILTPEQRTELTEEWTH